MLSQVEDGSKINTPLDIVHIAFLFQIGIDASIDDEASRHMFESTMHTILVDNSVIQTAFRNLSHIISGTCASIIKTSYHEVHHPKNLLPPHQPTPSSMYLKMKGPSTQRKESRSQAADLRPELSSCRYSHENCISCGYQYKHGTPNSKSSFSLEEVSP